MTQDTQEAIVEAPVEETAAVEAHVEDPVEAPVEETAAVEETESPAPPHLQAVPDAIPAHPDIQTSNVVIDVTSYPCDPSKVDGNHVICDCMMARLAFLENIVNHIPANVRMDMIRRMQGSISTLVGGLNV